MPDRRDTLRLALDPLPEPTSAWAFLNAHVVPGLGAAWRGALRCEQPWRGRYLDCRAAGYDVSASIGMPQVEGALVLATRSRALDDRNVARALAMVRGGGTVVVAGAKTDGIAALRKRFGPAEASVAKHHATAFLLRRGETVPEPGPDGRNIDGWTVPVGTFSDDGPDGGSRLLAGFLDRARGRIADLGAGWGFLAAGMDGPVDLYEADRRALDAARKNKPDGRFFWHDVVREPIAERYETVVMNPPFHQGRAAEPSLGQAFIARAAECLVPRGRLLMVANRRLPYEQVLSERFARVEKLADTDGFKVFQAVR